jgi:hypothetical protein
MNPQAIENIKKLEPFQRYQHFIKRIADFEELWTIIDEDGDYALSSLDEFTLIPFWSAEEFIASNLEEGWENCKSLKLTLNDLEDSIFEIIASENYLINVFPVDGRSGFVVSLNEFCRDLNEELKQYE